MEDQARPGLCDEFLYEKGINLSLDIRFDMFGSTDVDGLSMSFQIVFSLVLEYVVIQNDK